MNRSIGGLVMDVNDWIAIWGFPSLFLLAPRGAAEGVATAGACP
ncbi:MAG: hypothetical protein ACYCVH_01855 [Ignavibacteriaceae bacterium]